MVPNDPYAQILGKKTETVVNFSPSSPVILFEFSIKLYLIQNQNHYFSYSRFTKFGPKFEHV